MTIETTSNRVSYSGNGVTLAFAFPYHFLRDEDLVVVLKDDATGVETTQVIVTNYLVSGGASDDPDGRSASGTVTFGAAPAVGVTVVIYNDPPLTQTVDLVENEANPADVTEGTYDKLTIIAQRLKDRMDRSLRLTDAFTDAFDTTLPAALPAGQVFGVNGTGDGLTMFDPASLASGIVLPLVQGYAIYLGSGAFTARTFQVGQGLTISNPTGVSGDPTFTIPDDGILPLMLRKTVITGRVAKTAPAAADAFMVYDAAADALKQITVSTLLSQLISRANYVVNGNFDFWQRGTAFVTMPSGNYSADRWRYAKAVTTAVHTVLQTADAPTFAQSGFNSTWCLDHTISTADASVTATKQVRAEQRFEGYSWAKLKGQTVTLSFWVKGTKTGIHCVSFNNGSDRSYVAEYTINVTATWEYKTITLTLNPTGGTDVFDNTAGFIIAFALMVGSSFQTTAGSWQTGLFYGTSGAVNDCDTLANSLRFSQVMLTIGDTAPATFNRATGNYIEELHMCERYFEKSYPLAVTPGNVASGGAASIYASGSSALYPVRYRVRKRATPTFHSYAITTGSIDKIYDNTGAADISASLGNGNDTGANLSWTSLDGRQYTIHFTADAEL